MAFADFDGDSAADAVVNVGSGNYMLLRGDGNGAFYSRQRFPARWAVTDVLVTDLNQDDIPDLVGANHGLFGIETDKSGYMLSVHFGDGHGGFEESTETTFIFEPQFLIGADFNTDGLPDVAVTATDGPQLSILLGRGDGTFEPALERDTREYSTRGVAGDFNGDGVPDLALPSRDDEVLDIFRGLGDGTFADPISMPMGSGWFVIDSADFNADGLPDLVIAQQDAETRALLSNGDMTFHAATVPDAVDGTAVMTADINSDGNPDVVVGRSTADGEAGEVLLLLGAGDGSFLPPISSDVSGAPYHMIWGDFDVDGVPDLAATVQGGSLIHTLAGAGNGTFEDERRFMGVYPWTAALRSADLDLDGDTDLAAAGSSFAFPGLESLEMVVLFNETNPMPACDADLAPPFGVLDFDDVLAFLQAFTSGDPAADLAPAYGVLDFNDVAIFLAVFVSDCE